MPHQRLQRLTGHIRRVHRCERPALVVEAVQVAGGGALMLLLNVAGKMDSRFVLDSVEFLIERFSSVLPWEYVWVKCPQRLDVINNGLMQPNAVSYTHLRAHEKVLDLVCSLLH